MGRARDVIMELGSAASDPDGFLDMALEGMSGREALNVGKRLEKAIKASERFGPDIFTAQEAAAREEERGGRGDPREWTPRGG